MTTTKLLLVAVLVAVLVNIGWGAKRSSDQMRRDAAMQYDIDHLRQSANSLRTQLRLDEAAAVTIVTSPDGYMVSWRESRNHWHASMQRCTVWLTSHDVPTGPTDGWVNATIDNMNTRKCFDIPEENE